MRLVILTFESIFADSIASALLDHRRDQVAGVMRSRSLIAGKSLPAGATHIVKRGGVGFPMMKVKELMVAKASAVAGRIMGKGECRSSVVRRCRRLGIPVLPVTDINSDDAVSSLSAWRPDLLVSIYFNHRIGPEVLAIPTIGTLNVHGAVLPRNRGLFPYFWALANGETESGSTVHWVDEDYDTGDIVLQESFPIAAGDTAVSVQARSAELGARLLARSIDLIEAGGDLRRPQGNVPATYNSWPARTDVKRFKASGRKYGSICEIWRRAQ